MKVRHLQEEFSEKGFIEMVKILNEFTSSINTENMDGLVSKAIVPASGSVLVKHQLGSVPSGRIILRQDAAALLYDGSTWNNTHIEIANGTPTEVNITILILK